MFTRLFFPVLLVASSVITPVFSLPVPVATNETSLEAIYETDYSTTQNDNPTQNNILTQSDDPTQSDTPTQSDNSTKCNNLTQSNNLAQDSSTQNNSTQNNGNVTTPVPLSDTAKRFPDLANLVDGNKAFLSEIENSSNPNLLSDLTTKGQSPEYLFLGCSDSRVSEGTIFAAPPGLLFTQRNIANQFQSTDNSAVSVLSYGVDALDVSHIIVMGHYGCGGVQAAMLPKHNTTDDPSRTSVQQWIDPIRQTFLNSTRSEIVSFRDANKDKTTVDLPKFEDPAFRALVEENVKVSVSNIVTSAVMKHHWTAYLAQEHKTRRANPDAPLKPVYVHGFVYDISTGLVTDLGVSSGPNGPTSQAPPQDALKRAVDQVAHAH